MDRTMIDGEEIDPARTVVVATGNAHKLVEIEEILSTALPDVRFVALGQLGEFEEPEENGTTFFENALIKAQAAAEATGLPAIADDSGLMVDVLDGEPGVYSARYAGVHGDDAANNAKLKEKLAGVPDELRRGRFVSSIAFIDATGMVLSGEGTCEGAIGHEERGSHGFGYDPCFCRTIPQVRRWPSSPRRRRTPSAIASTPCRTSPPSSAAPRVRGAA